MVKILTILLLSTTMLLASPGIAFADKPPVKTIPMKKDNINRNDRPVDSWGHRIPAAPVICTISLTGIQITGFGSSPISLYEAYDEAGVCIASYASEEEFISFLYQTDEEIELRLYTDEYVFSGWW